MPYCTTCGSQIPIDATTCPSCGRSMPVGPRRTDGQAVASLVLGIVGLLMCPLVPSIIAVVIGSQAKARLQDDPMLQGAELARVGVILGWIGIGISTIGVVIAIIAFALVGATIGF